MGAATNIAIGATTTDFQAAFKAAQAVTNHLNGDITRLLTTFRGGIGATSGLTNAIDSQNKALRATAQASVEARNSMKDIGAQAISVKSLLTGAFSFGALVSFGQAIGQVSGKFEKYQAVLRTGLGSQSGAKDSLNMLTDFAANTPSSLDELTGSFIKFVNRGITPTRQQLTNLGDLAASQGKGFDQLTEAVLDAQSGEFERLKEFGIKAAKSGDQVTLSFKGVSKTVKNTSEDITNAIFGFGQLGGVAGGMAAVSQTLEGKLSNLGDCFDRLLVALGASGVAGGFKEAIDMGQRFLGFLTDLIAQSPVEDLRSQQTELNGLVGALALASDNEGVRLNLIQKIKQEYPEFLGNLNSESITTDLLSTRLAAVNEQYEKKIRIALGQARIKTATEQVTRAIDQQSNALQQLSLASGKSLTDLEKLGSAGRIALAKNLSKGESQVQRTSLGYIPVPSPMAAVASALERAGKTQTTAQAELNKLLGENATRQADLTKQTVSGYEQQIKLIREKINLHKIEKAEGLSEIKRLHDQILIAQGKPLPVTPILKPSTNTKTRAVTTAGLDTGNLAIFKRYAEQLKRQIESIGEDSPGLQQKQAELAAINDSIARLQALTAGNQKFVLPGLAELTGNTTKERVAGIVETVTKLGRTTPGLFANTGIGAFLSSLQQAKPSLDYYQAKVEEIKRTIAELANQGFKGDSPEIKKLIAQLADLKKALAEATGAAGAADAATNPGAQGEDDKKWIDKANQRIADMKAAGKAIKQTAQEMAGDMKQAHDFLAGKAIDVLTAVGEGLSQGTSPLKTILKTVLDFLGNFMIKIGSALVLGGTLLSAAETAFPFLAPLFQLKGPAGIIAGGALVVGGAAVKGLAGFAKGGVFTRPSVGLFGEYPGANMPDRSEIATPENLMRSVFKNELGKSGFQQVRDSYQKRGPIELDISLGGLYIRGSDLHLSQQRYMRTIQDYGL